MKRVAAVIRKTGLVFVNALGRMRSLLIASLLVGAVLCVLYTLFAGLAPSLSGPIMIGLIDKDDSAVSRDFQRYAREHLAMDFLIADEATLQSELVEKHIAAIIEIPAGFEAALVAGADTVSGGESAAFVVTYMDNYVNRVFLESYLEQYAASLDILAQGAGGDQVVFERMLSEAERVTVAVTIHELTSDLQASELKWTSFMIMIGFYLMISSLVTIGMAFVLNDDRHRGTFDRLRACDLPTLSYVLGTCGAGFIPAVLMTAVFLGFCAVAGVGEVVPLATVLVFCLVFGLYTVTFALLCGIVLKSHNAIQWATITASTILCLLGGAFYPLDYAPAIMQQLAHISPMYWVSDALAQLQAGADLAACLPNLGVLALFATLCALIAAVRFAGRHHSVR
jgi:ABC-2 type transport system permease protein